MIVNANSIVQHVIQIKNAIMKHVNVNVKIILSCTCICEDRRYLKTIANTSVVPCDEIISVIDILSTKMINTIAVNVSINYDDKKVRYKIDCYILHPVLLMNLLLLIIALMCYHYVKHRSKQKDNDALTI